jgi:peptide/nickel transport system permease protein
MATTDPVSDFSLDVPGALARREAGEAPTEGLGPWKLGLRRLRRNKTALAFGFLFVLLVGACLAAPLYGEHISHTNATENHLSDTVEVGGETKNVVGLDGVPIGPTWQGEFLLGADPLGRDIMTRLLYGGRNSLVIGLTAALLTTLLSIVLGLVAGYFRGWTDGVISRLLDVIWSFPVIILGVALGVSLALGGLNVGKLLTLGAATFGPTIPGSSLLIPIFVISIVYVPYMARPLRGQVMSLREKEFVEAARAQGMGPGRIMFGEVLPNLASTILVFFTLLVANAILLEAALSFLGAGVRPPKPSWGVMIEEGVDRIGTAPHLTVVPGLMLVLTVLSLNVLGDGVRDALDPRAKVRLEH